jgi:type I restriction enzyme S subunit
VSEPANETLPNNWRLESLNVVAMLVRGVTYKREDAISNATDGYIPLLRATNITGSSLTFSDLVFVPQRCVSSDQLLISGDVVIASSSGSKEIVGKAGQFIGRAFRGSFGAFCIGIRPSSMMCGRYLGYYFQTPNYRKAISDLSAGSNINNIKSSELSEHLIPIAPLAEQTRIVEKLEELLSDLDAGVAELKAAQKKLVQYRQSLLKAAVEGALTAEWRTTNQPKETGTQLLERILIERRARWEAKQLAKFKEQGKAPPKDWQAKYPEPVKPDTNDLPELPEGWIWASLDQVASTVRNGLSQKPSQEPIGYPILRINAVRPMSVNLNEVRYLALAETTVTEYILENGDILATRYNGSVDLLGVFGVVRGLTTQTLHPDKLIRIKPVLDSKLADWIEICAAIGESRRHIVSRVKTTAGQTGISGEDVKKMPIPLAPLLEQEFVIERLTTSIQEISSQGYAVDTSLKQSALQRKNILKAAFSGQLVPQDSNDEPAIFLLERIQAERSVQAASKMPLGRKRKQLA